MLVTLTSYYHSRSSLRGGVATEVFHVRDLPIHTGKSGPSKCPAVHHCTSMTRSVKILYTDHSLLNSERDIDREDGHCHCPLSISRCPFIYTVIPN
jgi:hypothetical protein